MEIKFSNVLLKGDFSLVNEKSIDCDKDFILKCKNDIFRLFLNDNLFRIEVLNVKRILVRIAHVGDVNSIHLLNDTDLYSSFFNYDFKNSVIEIKENGSYMDMYFKG